MIKNLSSSSLIKLNKKLVLVVIALVNFLFFYCMPNFATKYTITNGLTFNTRVKLKINENYTSASEDRTIVGFKYSDTLPDDKSKLIDISEDNDSSVLAYIDNNILYYVSEEDVYLNQDASYMFDKFLAIKTVDLSYFNFVKIKKTNFMFSNCRSLVDINMDNDTTINLREIQGMFYNCQSLVDLNIFMLNTKNVKNMNSLFYNCKNLKNIIISNSNWKISSVMDFENMFTNCYLLKTNFGKKAVDIDSNLYSKYAIAGDDDVEGLLKDVDYEYDNYGNKNETYKIDSLTEKIIVSNDDINIESKIDKKNVNIQKENIKVNISSDSVFYHETVNNYNLGSNNSDKETADGVAILLDETTSVERLIRKKKPGEASNSVVDKIIEDEETTINIGDIKGGVLRPDYSKMNLSTDSIANNNKINNENINDNIEVDETYNVNDESIINKNDSESENMSSEDKSLENETENTTNSNDESYVTFKLPSFMLIILGVVLFILLGIVISFIKNKNEKL